MKVEMVYFFYLTAFLFSAGTFIILSKKNLVFVLIGVELMLNSANLFLVGFSQGREGHQGQVMAIFAVVLTVCEVAIALAILLQITKYFKASDIDKLKEVKNG